MAKDKVERPSRNPKRKQAEEKKRQAVKAAVEAAQGDADYLIELRRSGKTVPFYADPGAERRFPKEVRMRKPTSEEIKVAGLSQKEWDKIKRKVGVV